MKKQKLNKDLLIPGILVRIKPNVIKNNYGYSQIFEEGKVYKVKKVTASRVQLLDPETNRNIGEVTISQLELTSREDLADSIEGQAKIMIERANMLIEKAERLKKYESDEEEICALIEECISRKFNSKEILHFLKDSNVEIGYKE